MDMTMSMSMPTGTGSAAAATSTADMDMDSMMGGCKISMLWNWYTVDACFISSQWRVTSSGYFAGTCIGVICLVMTLPLLRFVHQRYDKYIRDQSMKKLAAGRGRPTILQQAIRSLLYTAQFAVAYFVMLLAMYYNGYIIICILIGAFLGYFAFEWREFAIIVSDKNDASEVTGCCG